MTDAPVVATLVLGFVLGLRHALDADHVAAVAALSSGRGGLRRALATGVSWGVGHAAVLGAVGFAVLLLRVGVPARLALLFELAVGVMLVALGAAAIGGALRARLHAHRHEHDGVAHEHLHFHVVPHAEDGEPGDHRHPHPLRLELRPLLVGGVHGLAGSAAISLLVLTTLPTIVLGCLYLGLFGAGSVAGMALMSLALAAPLSLARRCALRLHRALRFAAGLGSLGLGLSLSIAIGRHLLG
jgi:hypothetical protein